jgi:hypothetical protein
VLVMMASGARMVCARVKVCTMIIAAPRCWQTKLGVRRAGGLVAGVAGGACRWCGNQ